MKLIISALLLVIAFAIIVESKAIRQNRQVNNEGFVFSDDDNDKENQFTTTTRRTTTPSAYDAYLRPTTEKTTTTPAAPVNNQTVFQRCMKGCLITSEHNPLCGTNRQTYNNIGQLTCAKNCGLKIEILFRGVCSA